MSADGRENNRVKSTKPKRILLVEDEENTIKVVKDILDYMFGENDVRVARDGHDAIRMAFDQKPDIILMDLSLPKLNGWEATRSIKSNEDFHDVPVLAITAHAMVGDRERALEVGCDDYYAKPIEVDKFISFMRPYLNSEES
ncbi:MAG: response regulator [Anaerolineales bacterium]|nr:response regulator [Anaerolineales bacterium]